MSDILLIFQGNLSPSISDVIRVNNRPYDLSEKSVQFSMRPVDSSDPTLDHVSAVVVEATDGSVRYDWQPGDTDVPGRYAFWWTVVLSEGVTQDTPEQRLDIDAHEPSGDVGTGVILERMRMVLPTTVNGMIADPNIGDAALQRHIDVIKFNLLGESILPADEADLRIDVVEHIAKVAAIRLIPSAVDWWGDKSLSVSTSGTDENVSYPERREQLWNVYDRLRYEILPKKIISVDGEWVVARRSMSTGGPTVRQPGTTNRKTINPNDFPSEVDVIVGPNWTGWSV